MEINVLKDFFVPVVIGVLSSVIFLVLASHVKPDLAISEHIARMPQGACCVEEGSYAVKVFNKSKRSATEVKAKLSLVRKVNVAKGQINRTDDFPLIKDSIFELPANTGNPEDSAFRFITRENIELYWAGDAYILFTVYARDALTGFGKVFSKAYYLNRDALKDGEFEVGDSMRIA